MKLTEPIEESAMSLSPNLIPPKGKMTKLKGSYDFRTLMKARFPNAKKVPSSDGVEYWVINGKVVGKFDRMSNGDCYICDE